MQTYLRILKYAWRYPGLVIGSVLLSILVAMLYAGQIVTLIPVFNLLFDPNGVEKAMVNPTAQPYLVALADVVGSPDQLTSSVATIERTISSACSSSSAK